MVKRVFKTKKKVGGSLPRNFHPWARNNGTEPVWEEGDYVIGKFITTITDNYKKDCPVLEVYEANLSNDVLDKDGNAVEIEGKNLQLNACGSLTWQMFGENDKGKEAVKEGEVIQVMYTGKDVMEDGPYAGKPFHTVEVSIMEEDEEEIDEDLY
jgi:hypothetical protein